MSEQTIPARVDALESQLARIAAATERNTSSIDALIKLADRQRDTDDRRFKAIETRLGKIERGIEALNEGNQLIAELIRSRLPAPGPGEK
jgi:cell division protein FtsB